MSPTSELWFRNRARFSSAGRTLWLNPPVDAPWRDLDIDPTRLRMFSQDFGTWRRLARDGANVRFGDFPDSDEERADTLLLDLPREKERLRMLTHCAAGLLAGDGTLWLAGENRAGIRSSPRHLAEWFDQVGKTDSARHCALVRATRPRDQEPFDVDAYRTRWDLEIDGKSLTVCSWPGVFAHGDLDDGTRLLVENLPDVTAGARVLDFGCGAGVIGLALLAREPRADVVMVDSNALACRAAAASLSANGRHGTVVASDGFSELVGTFDHIVSNPPFHSGNQTLMGLAPSLLGPVRNFLNPGGQLTLVANRHLPYRRWLDESFGSHELVAADERYHVLRVTHRPEDRQ